MSALETFEKLLAQGKDNTLLRYSLGNECLKAGRFADACVHLRAALAFDPAYSAAWKLLGKALTEADEPTEARAAYRQGIAAAEARGDIQAAREMKVFARRLDKRLGDAPMDSPGHGDPAG
jgi:predicted Zn-dependent protease